MNPISVTAVEESFCISFF